MNLSTHDLIIIGAVPAGLTAGLYAGRARLKTVILEKMFAGGRILMSETIENYPGFPDSITTQELVGRMERQVRNLGVEFAQAEAVELIPEEKAVRTPERSYAAKAIIIASGATPRKLGAKGENELIGKGVSYCATCDGPLYREKEVVLVGGGNAVAGEALYLGRFVKNVTIIHRRDELRAAAILQEKLQENRKVNFLLSHIVTQVLGPDRVSGVRVKDVKTGQERDFPCAGVFVYIGYDPDTGFAKGKVDTDEAGFIVTNEEMAASKEGIFACGDCRRKPLYQVITACSDGAVAAEAAAKYIG